MLDRTQRSVKHGNIDDVVQLALPIIADGLVKGSNDVEFQIGNYMLITLLVSRAPLNDEIIVSIMDSITSNWTPQTVIPAIACLSFLAQEREGICPVLPTNIVSRFLKSANIADRMLELGTKYRADKLSAGLCLGILSKYSKYGTEKYHGLKFLETIVGKARISRSQKKAIIKALIGAVMNSGTSDTAVIKGTVSLMDGLKGNAVFQEVLKEKGNDVELLELQLGIVLLGSLETIETQEDQQILTVKGIQKVNHNGNSIKEVFRKRLAELPTTSQHDSFLDIAPDASYNTCVQAFLIAASHTSTLLSELLNHPFLAQTSLRQITFLINIWTSALPAIAKEAALQSCSMLITTNNNNNTADYQALIPFSLLGLSDTSERVRRSAVKLIECIAGTYRITTTNKKSKNLEFWGIKDLYGSSTASIKWLSTEEASKFIDAIKQNGLDECILDPSVFKGFLAKTVSGFKQSFRNTVLAFLSSHVLIVPDLNLKHRLLSTITSVPSSSKGKFFLPLLQWWVSLTPEERSELSTQFDVDQAEFEKTAIGIVDSNDRGEGIELLRQILSSEGNVYQTKSLVQSVGERIVETWEDGLKAELRTSLSDSLLKLALSSVDEDTVHDEQLGASEALDILRRVKLSTKTFQIFLGSLSFKASNVDVDIDIEQQAKRRRKTSSSSNIHEKQLRRAVIILELLEGDHPENHISLLGELFNVLGKVLSVQETTEIGVDYLVQVIISCLLSVVSGIKVSRPHAQNLHVEM